MKQNGSKCGFEDVEMWFKNCQTSKSLEIMQEQDALLASYDEANREAAQHVKALEVKLKDQEAAMVEERRALERQLVRAVEAQQLNNADTAKNLRCVRWISPCLVCHCWPLQGPGREAKRSDSSNGGGTACLCAASCAHR
jgi:hypothetical protein